MEVYDLSIISAQLRGSGVTERKKGRAACEKLLLSDRIEVCITQNYGSELLHAVIEYEEAEIEYMKKKHKTMDLSLVLFVKRVVKHYVQYCQKMFHFHLKARSRQDQSTPLFEIVTHVRDILNMRNLPDRYKDEHKNILCEILDFRIAHSLAVRVDTLYNLFNDIKNMMSDYTGMCNAANQKLLKLFCRNLFASDRENVLFIVELLFKWFGEDGNSVFSIVSDAAGGADEANLAATVADCCAILIDHHSVNIQSIVFEHSLNILHVVIRQLPLQRMRDTYRDPFLRFILAFLNLSMKSHLNLHRAFQDDNPLTKVVYREVDVTSASQQVNAESQSQSMNMNMNNNNTASTRIKLTVLDLLCESLSSEEFIKGLVVHKAAVTSLKQSRDAFYNPLLEAKARLYFETIAVAFSLQQLHRSTLKQSSLIAMNVDRLLQRISSFVLDRKVQQHQQSQLLASNSGNSSNNNNERSQATSFMNQTQSTASQSSAVQNPSRLETNEVLFEGLLLILQSLVKRFPYGEFLSSSIVLSKNTLDVKERIRKSTRLINAVGSKLNDVLATNNMQLLGSLFLTLYGLTRLSAVLLNHARHNIGSKEVSANTPVDNMQEEWSSIAEFLLYEVNMQPYSIICKKHSVTEAYMTLLCGIFKFGVLPPRSRAALLPSLWHLQAIKEPTYVVSPVFLQLLCILIEHSRNDIPQVFCSLYNCQKLNMGRSSAGGHLAVINMMNNMSQPEDLDAISPRSDGPLFGVSRSTGHEFVGEDDSESVLRLLEIQLGVQTSTIQGPLQVVLYIVCWLESQLNAPSMSRVPLSACKDFCVGLDNLVRFPLQKVKPPSPYTAAVRSFEYQVPNHFVDQVSENTQQYLTGKSNEGEWTGISTGLSSDFYCTALPVDCKSTYGLGHLPADSVHWFENYSTCFDDNFQATVLSYLGTNMSYNAQFPSSLKHFNISHDGHYLKVAENSGRVKPGDASLQDLYNDRTTAAATSSTSSTARMVDVLSDSLDYPTTSVYLKDLKEQDRTFVDTLELMLNVLETMTTKVLSAKVIEAQKNEVTEGLTTWQTVGLLLCSTIKSLCLDAEEKKQGRNKGDTLLEVRLLQLKGAQMFWDIVDSLLQVVRARVHIFKWSTTGDYLECLCGACKETMSIQSFTTRNLDKSYRDAAQSRNRVKETLTDLLQTIRDYSLTGLKLDSTYMDAATDDSMDTSEGTAVNRGTGSSSNARGQSQKRSRKKGESVAFDEDEDDGGDDMMGDEVDPVHSQPSSADKYADDFEEEEEGEGDTIKHAKDSRLHRHRLYFSGGKQKSFVACATMYVVANTNHEDMDIIMETLLVRKADKRASGSNGNSAPTESLAVQYHKRGGQLPTAYRSTLDSSQDSVDEFHDGHFSRDGLLNKTLYLWVDSDIYLMIGESLAQIGSYHGIYNFLNTPKHTPWDKDWGPLGYYKVLCITYNLTARPQFLVAHADEGNPRLQVVQMLLKIALCNSQVFVPFVPLYWRIRYMQVLCVCNFIDMNHSHYDDANYFRISTDDKVFIKDFFLNALEDVDYRVRLCAAQRVHYLLAYFSKHEVIYNTLVAPEVFMVVKEKAEHSNMAYDHLQQVTQAVTIARMGVSNPSLTRVALLDLFRLSVVRRNVPSYHFYSLLHRLVIYMSTVLGYESPVDFMMEHFRWLLYQWLQNKEPEIDHEAGAYIRLSDQEQHPILDFPYFLFMEAMYTSVENVSQHQLIIDHGQEKHSFLSDTVKGFSVNVDGYPINWNYPHLRMCARFLIAKQNLIVPVIAQISPSKRDRVLESYCKLIGQCTIAGDTMNVTVSNKAAIVRKALPALMACEYLAQGSVGVQERLNYLSINPSTSSRSKSSRNGHSDHSSTAGAAVATSGHGNGNGIDESIEGGTTDMDEDDEWETTDAKKAVAAAKSIAVPYTTTKKDDGKRKKSAPSTSGTSAVDSVDIDECVAHLVQKLKGSAYGDDQIPEGEEDLLELNDHASLQFGFIKNHIYRDKLESLQKSDAVETVYELFLVFTQRSANEKEPLVIIDYDEIMMDTKYDNLLRFTFIRSLHILSTSTAWHSRISRYLPLPSGFTTTTSEPIDFSVGSEAVNAVLQDRFSFILNRINIHDLLASLHAQIDGTTHVGAQLAVLIEVEFIFDVIHGIFVYDGEASSPSSSATAATSKEKEGGGKKKKSVNGKHKSNDACGGEAEDRSNFMFQIGNRVYILRAIFLILTAISRRPLTSIVLSKVCKVINKVSLHLLDLAFADEAREEGQSSDAMDVNSPRSSDGDRDSSTMSESQEKQYGWTFAADEKHSFTLAEKEEVLYDLFSMNVCLLHALHLCRTKASMHREYATLIEEEQEASDTHMDVDESLLIDIVPDAFVCEHYPTAIELEPVFTRSNRPSSQSIILRRQTYATWRDRIDGSIQYISEVMDKVAQTIMEEREDLRISKKVEDLRYPNIHRMILPVPLSFLESLSVSNRMDRVPYFIKQYQNKKCEYLENPSVYKKECLFKLKTFVSHTKALLMGQLSSVTSLWMELLSIGDLLHVDLLEIQRLTDIGFGGEVKEKQAQEAIEAAKNPSRGKRKSLDISSGSTDDPIRISLGKEDGRDNYHLLQQMRTSVWNEDAELTASFLSCLILLHKSTILQSSMAFKKKIMEMIGHVGPPDLLALGHTSLPFKIHDPLSISGSNINNLKTRILSMLYGLCWRNPRTHAAVSSALRRMCTMTDPVALQTDKDGNPYIQDGSQWKERYARNNGIRDAHIESYAPKVNRDVAAILPSYCSIDLRSNVYLLYATGHADADIVKRLIFEPSPVEPWDKSIWKTRGKSYKEWVCKLTSSIIQKFYNIDKPCSGHMSANIEQLKQGFFNPAKDLPHHNEYNGRENNRAFITPLAVVCAMHHEIAESLLPLILYDIVKGTDVDQSVGHSSSNKLATLISKYLLSPTCKMHEATRLGCNILIFFLRQEVDLFKIRVKAPPSRNANMKGKKESSKAQEISRASGGVERYGYRLNIDLTFAAEAAARCGCVCSALIFAELAYENRQIEWNESRPEYMSHSRREETVSLLMNIFKGVHDPDALFGMLTNGAGLRTQALVYSHTGNYKEALSSYESLIQANPSLTGDITNNEAVKGIAHALRGLGTQHTLSSLVSHCQSEQADKRKYGGNNGLLSSSNEDLHLDGLSDMASEGEWRSIGIQQQHSPQHDNSRLLSRASEASRALSRWEPSLSSTNDNDPSFNSTHMQNLLFGGLLSRSTHRNRATGDAFFNSNMARALSDFHRGDVSSAMLRVKDCTDSLLPRIVQVMNQESAYDVLPSLAKAQQCHEISEVGKLLRFAQLQQGTMGIQREHSLNGEPTNTQLTVSSMVNNVMQRWHARSSSRGSSHGESIITNESVLALRLSLLTELLDLKIATPAQGLDVMDQILYCIPRGIHGRNIAHTLSPLAYKLRNSLISIQKILPQEVKHTWHPKWILQECKLLWHKGLDNLAVNNLSSGVIQALLSSENVQAMLADDPSLLNSSSSSSRANKKKKGESNSSSSSSSKKSSTRSNFNAITSAMNAAGMVECDLMSEAYRLRGEWTSTKKIATGGDILSEFMVNATRCAVTAEERIKAHFTKASFNDRLYQSMKARLHSTEHKQFVRMYEARAAEKARLNAIKNNPGNHEFIKANTDFHRHYRMINTECENDEKEIESVEDSLVKHLQMALEGYQKVLKISEKEDVDVVFRVTNLWLQNFERPRVNEIVERILRNTAPFKFVPLSYQMMSLLGSKAHLGTNGGHNNNTSSSAQESSLSDSNNTESPRGNRSSSTLSAIATRLSIESSTANAEFQRILQQLVTRLCVSHPYHVFPQLFALVNRDPVDPANDNENPIEIAPEAKSNKDRFEIASGLIRWMKQSSNVGSALAAQVNNYEALLKAYIDLAYVDMNAFGKVSVLKFSEIQSRSNRFNDCINNMKLKPPIITLTPTLQKKNLIGYGDMVDEGPLGLYESKEVVRIAHVEPTFTITDSGVSKPKIIKVVGTDGITYKQLVKGKDDMRQDAVMQQVFENVNQTLALDEETNKRRLGMRTYKCVPTSPQSGVIEWVENARPFGDVLGASSRSNGLGLHERYYPNDWSHNQCRQHIRTGQDMKQKEFKGNKKGYEAELVKRLTEVYENFHPAFRFFFIESFPDPAKWMSCRLAYTRSVAVNSMVGYILGIGDRHTNNILVDSETAELIHIDFGIVFDQGKVLPTPELIPFRLSRDLVDGMGITGVEGTFRRSSEQVLRVMRNNASQISTILEVVIHDPLYKWSLSPLEAREKQTKSSKDNATGLSIGAAHTKHSSFSEKDKVGSGGGLVDLHQVQKHTDQITRDTAERTLMKIQRKMQGYDDETTGEALSIEGQVELLINSAVDKGRLSKCYHGWAAWL